jgi:tripartite-type tricarboxylate transporter receptor subunit TctC
MAPTFLGRPYMMGPGTPPERVTAMRKAMMESFNDPALRAEAEAGKLDLDPVSGEEVQVIIKQAYSAPQPLIERLRALYSAAESK